MIIDFILGPTNLIPALLMSSLLFYYQNILRFPKFSTTCTPQLIHPWSMINYPGILLLIVDWFAYLTPDIFLPMNQSLILCYINWSSAIKSSSDFWTFSCTWITQLIDPWWILNYPGILLLITDWFAFLTQYLLLSPTDPALGMLLLSLVFCYKIFLWLLKLCLAVAFHNWYTPDKSSTTLVFCGWLLIVSHLWPHIYFFHWPGRWSTDVVTGLLLSNIPLIFEQFLFTQKVIYP